MRWPALKENMLEIYPLKMLNFQHISYTISARVNTLSGWLCKIYPVKFYFFSACQRISYIYFSFSALSALILHILNFFGIFVFLLWIQKQHQSKTKEHCTRAVQLKKSWKSQFYQLLRQSRYRSWSIYPIYLI